MNIATVIFLLLLVFVILACPIYVLSPIWKEFIWKMSKAKVFRIVREGSTYYAEMRFLHFFFIRMDGVSWETMDDCVEYIYRFMRERRVTKQTFDFSTDIPTKIE